MYSSVHVSIIERRERERRVFVCVSILYTGGGEGMAAVTVHIEALWRKIQLSLTFFMHFFTKKINLNVDSHMVCK